MFHIQVSCILLNQIRWLYFYMESLLTGSFRFEGKSVHLMGRWYRWGILLTNVWAYSKMDFPADLIHLLKWLNIPTPNLLFFQCNARALILTLVEGTLFLLEDWASGEHGDCSEGRCYLPKPVLFMWRRSLYPDCPAEIPVGLFKIIWTCVLPGPVVLKLHQDHHSLEHLLKYRFWPPPPPPPPS